MFTSSAIGTYSGLLKNTDNNYLLDWNQMTALNIYNINTTYWLTSRNVGSSGYSNYYFGVRYVDSSGNVGRQNLLSIESGKNTLGRKGAGLRPVFTLNPGLIITGGSGTENDPYTLGV